MAYQPADYSSGKSLEIGKLTSELKQLYDEYHTYVIRVMKMSADMGKVLKNSSNKMAEDQYVFEKELIAPLRGIRLFSVN